MSDILERTLAGLKQALVSSPDNGALHLQVGELLLELGRRNEAAEACRAALACLDDETLRQRAQELLASLCPAGGPSNVVQLRRRGAAADDGNGGMRPANSAVTFADVGGLDAVKEDIRMKIILPFQQPGMFAAYGKKSGGGILLYGPPGCGKTLLARATAGECGAAFFNVAIDAILDMYYGESERKLAAAFTQARAAAPAVLFFDELEAIGGSRQQIRHSPGKSLVNQLLAEMDGLEKRNERLLIMAATNAPWYVDAALRRPGRFDRVVFVPPPDATARLEILRLHLRQRPLAADFDLGRITKMTKGYSGADLLALVERAMETPLKEALRSGEVRPATNADMQAALAAIQPTTAEWFSTARNYATFANTSGLYDHLLQYLKDNS